MQRKSHTTSDIVGTVVLIVVVPLALYVGGYFALGSYQGDSDLTSRDYSYSRLTLVYRPLARVEAAVTGKAIFLWDPSMYYETDGQVGDGGPIPKPNDINTILQIKKSTP